MSTVETKVGHFVWHENLSSDAEAAKTFYSKLLGWEYEIYKPGEMDYAMISSGGAAHGGFWPEPPQGAKAAWQGHVLVEDVDGAAERAKKLGGTILHGPMDMPEIGRFALIQDPYGAVVSAYAPVPSDSPVGEGVFVWDELSSPDVEGSKRFYTEVFGWTAEDQDMGGGVTYTIFGKGETQVAGLMKQMAQAAGQPAEWHPYMGVDDVDATAQKAVGLGATELVPGTDIPGMGRFAMLLDPNGAMFGIFSPTAS
jgi:predicted enzyme related to lactoylglutathione lyase